jgi:hypothetical protein
MKLVIIESPYAGDIERNVRYARACLRHSLGKGEAPYASHLIYTQPGVLRDANPGERAHGIAAGFAWGEKADLTAVYTDLGVSKGMEAGIAEADRVGRRVEYRSLGGEWAR